MTDIKFSDQLLQERQYQSKIRSRKESREAILCFGYIAATICGSVILGAIISCIPLLLGNIWENGPLLGFLFSFLIGLAIIVVLAIVYGLICLYEDAFGPLPEPPQKKSI